MDRKKKNDEYVFKFGSLVVCDFSVSGAEFFIIGNDGKEFLLANEDNLGFFCNEKYLTLVHNDTGFDNICAELRRKYEEKYINNDLKIEGYMVQLKYFKLSGKYYSEGHYRSYRSFMDEIFREVRQLKEQGKLPGLAEGAKEFIVFVTVPDHDNNHPHLIL